MSSITLSHLNAGSGIILEQKQNYVDHDRLFKELIKTFFQEFIEAFFPQVYTHMKFSSVTFLEQEVFTDILVGEKRQIDILAEVNLKGKERIVLIHIEPQSTYQKEFHERMFIYCSRLYEKHRKPILPLLFSVIITIKTCRIFLRLIFPKSKCFTFAICNST